MYRNTPNKCPPGWKHGLGLQRTFSSVMSVAFYRMKIGLFFFNCSCLDSASHLTRNRQTDLQYMDDDPHEYLLNWGMTMINLSNVTDLVRQLLTTVFNTHTLWYESSGGPFSMEMSIKISTEIFEKNCTEISIHVQNILTGIFIQILLTEISIQISIEISMKNGPPELSYYGVVNFFYKYTLY